METCNDKLHYKCADWVNSETLVSSGFKCSDTENCGKEYKSDGETYDIVCTGVIGADCKEIGTTDSCNTAFNYTCADWVDSSTFHPLPGPRCQDSHTCNSTYTIDGK